jgi:hypothetical protein
MTITLHIVLLKPPAGIAFGLQKGSGSKYEPVQVQRSVSDDLVFTFDIEIKGDKAKNDRPGFGGAFVQGAPSDRFIYIDIGTYAGQELSFGGRLKIPLIGISWHIIDQLKNDPELILETRVAGTGKNGGPNYATVKPFDGWSIKMLSN